MRMASIGVAPRVCKASTPQTKGKVERTVGFAKHSYWAGVCFTDMDDLNRQAHGWCERINTRVHRTRTSVPVIVGSVKSFPPCRRRLPGNALPPKSGIRQLGWL